MKSLLYFAKQFLAKRPALRRKIVNTIYRIPALDMRLRAILDQRDNLAWRRVDANDLPEDVREVYEKLRNRMKRS
jgi:hypothetical protein